MYITNIIKNILFGIILFLLDPDKLTTVIFKNP